MDGIRFQPGDFLIRIEDSHGTKLVRPLSLELTQRLSHGDHIRVLVREVQQKLVELCPIVSDPGVYAVRRKVSASRSRRHHRNRAVQLRLDLARLRFRDSHVPTHRFQGGTFGVYLREVATLRPRKTIRIGLLEVCQCSFGFFQTVLVFSDSFVQEPFGRVRTFLRGSERAFDQRREKRFDDTNGLVATGIAVGDGSHDAARLVRQGTRLHVDCLQQSP